MSVEQHLGLDTNLERVISGEWPKWVEQRPTLDAVADPTHLRAWLQATETDLGTDHVKSQPARRSQSAFFTSFRSPSGENPFKRFLKCVG
mgnify:CR=1 FL=1